MPNQQGDIFGDIFLHYSNMISNHFLLMLNLDDNYINGFKWEFERFKAVFERYIDLYQPKIKLFSYVLYICVLNK
jgi:hypothetical protein